MGCVTQLLFSYRHTEAGQMHQAMPAYAVNGQQIPAAVHYALISPAFTAARTMGIPAA